MSGAEAEVAAILFGLVDDETFESVMRALTPDPRPETLLAKRLSKIDPRELIPTGKHRLIDGYCPDCSGSCLVGFVPRELTDSEPLAEEPGEVSPETAADFAVWAGTSRRTVADSPPIRDGHALYFDSPEEAERARVRLRAASDPIAQAVERFLSDYDTAPALDLTRAIERLRTAYARESGQRLSPLAVADSDDSDETP